MRHDRRWFGRLEQEDQRLKKHYGRWMDIVRSLELESFILTKLTKPSVPVNLVGPQVSLPQRWVPASRGGIHFLCVIRRHFLACEDVAGGSQQSWGNVFFVKYSGPSGGSQLSGGGIIIFTVIRRHFLAAAVDPAVSVSDGSRSLTTLTTPRREHQGGGRRRGLGRGRRGAGEDAVVEARAERSTRVHWFGCGVRLPSPQNNRGCG